MSWETILGILTHPVTQIVIAGTAGLAIKEWSRYKKLYKEVNEVARVVLAARNEKSAGGRKITQAEWATIGKEAVDVINAIAKL